MVVTHSVPLAADLSGIGAAHVELVKELGETGIAGMGPFDRPRWDWGTR